MLSLQLPGKALHVHFLEILVCIQCWCLDHLLFVNSRCNPFKLYRQIIVDLFDVRYSLLFPAMNVKVIVVSCLI